MVQDVNSLTACYFTKSPTNYLNHTLGSDKVKGNLIKVYTEMVEMSDKTVFLSYCAYLKYVKFQIHIRVSDFVISLTSLCEVFYCRLNNLIPTPWRAIDWLHSMLSSKGWGL